MRGRELARIRPAWRTAARCAMGGFAVPKGPAPPGPEGEGGCFSLRRVDYDDRELSALGSLLPTLRCPARRSLGARLLADRCTNEAFAVSSTGRARLHSQLGWGTMSAFLLCAGTVRQKEEKRTEKKFRRTGLLERHSLSGLRVAATYAASLVLTRVARRSRQRRFGSLTVFIPASQSWMQKARRLGEVRRYRSRLGASG